MEDLIRGRRRPDDIVIDPAMSDRVEDRPTRRSITEGAPVDQQPPLGVRIEVSRRFEQLGSGHSGEPLSGQDQRNLLPGGCQVSQPGPRLLRRLRAPHPIVPRVPVPELLLDTAQGSGIVFHSQQHRTSHEGTSMRRDRVRRRILIEDTLDPDGISNRRDTTGSRAADGRRSGWNALFVSPATTSTAGSSAIRSERSEQSDSRIARRRWEEERVERAFRFTRDDEHGGF